MMTSPQKTDSISLQNMTPTPEMLILAKEVALILDQAADLTLLRHEFGLKNVYLKKDGSSLTLADELISEMLELRLPNVRNVPVVSEENIERILRTHKDTPPSYWLIDPIDGTDNYIKGYPGYGICVALIENGQPVIGVVAAPHGSIDSIYLAASGAGAYRRAIGSQELTRIHTREDSLSNPDYNFATYFNFTDEEWQAQEDYLKQHVIDANQTSKGAIIKYTELACGNFDFAGGWKLIHTWDVAAAECIISEAGGVLINARTGQRLDYNDLEQMELSSTLALSARAHAKYGNRLIKSG